MRLLLQELCLTPSWLSNPTRSLRSLQITALPSEMPDKLASVQQQQRCCHGARSDVNRDSLFSPKNNRGAH